MRRPAVLRLSGFLPNLKNTRKALRYCSFLVVWDTCVNPLHPSSNRYLPRHLAVLEPVSGEN